MHVMLAAKKKSMNVINNYYLSIVVVWVGWPNYLLRLSRKLLSNLSDLTFKSMYAIVKLNIIALNEGSKVMVWSYF